jgi:type 1 glutamine amidotransferase
MIRRTASPRVALAVAACVLTTGATVSVLVAQQPPAPSGDGVTGAHFRLFDKNADGAITRDEMRATLDGWYAQWDGSTSNALDARLLFGAGGSVFPAPAPGDALPQNQTPDPADVGAMVAALPAAAPAKPKQPRKVLVLGRAVGFVHATIPLAARTIEELGKKTGAWSTTITYDAADISDANLKQYDAVFLASTTGEFLDAPGDARATAARKQALLAFVRGGKGLAGIHAATDGYHRSAVPGPLGSLNLQTLPLAIRMMGADRSGDGRITREEFAGLADAWFDALDTEKSGRVTRAAFPQRYPALLALPKAMPGGGAAMAQGPARNREADTEEGTWPEYNQMIGGFFKFHWNDGQSITVKLDEPTHPINAPFKGKGYVIVDETYTFGRKVYSRANLRVLTSIDYAAMSAADKAKEEYPRPDGDYALSWIRREGKGRVFYEAHGHNEQAYANPALLGHLVAGLQYVLGDLSAEDGPSTAAAK